MLHLNRAYCPETKSVMTAACRRAGAFYPHLCCRDCAKENSSGDDVCQNRSSNGLLQIMRPSENPRRGERERAGIEMGCLLGGT